jgi:hypothetical protein
MPMENSRSSLTGGKVQVDCVYITEGTCILGGATQDAQFVEIFGEPSYCCSVPLPCLAFLVAARPPFVCLVEPGNRYR